MNLVVFNGYVDGAMGVILAGIPCVVKVDIDSIKTGDKLVVDADNATVELV